jgi:hypothetical protein
MWRSLAATLLVVLGVNLGSTFLPATQGFLRVEGASVVSLQGSTGPGDPGPMTPTVPTAAR